MIFSKSQIPEHLHRYFRPAELGAEKSPAEYVAALVAVFAEVRRVLADDGTLWLNLGDSYYSGKGSPTQPDVKNEARRPPRRVLDQSGAEWGRPKSLLGIPWRVAFALQDDGWILRNDIIWAKPNGMPESVTDRLSTKHEHLFLFAKSRRYWFDLGPLREPMANPDVAERPQKRRARELFDAAGLTVAHLAAMRAVGMSDAGKALAIQDGAGKNAVETQRLADEAKAALGGYYREFLYDEGRNPGDWWVIPTQPFAEAHFATFPVELPRRCIAAGCKPGGVVLDPFSGSGTTGLAAAELGRRYVGIDLNRDYLELSLRTRLSQPSLTAEAGS